LNTDLGLLQCERNNNSFVNVKLHARRRWEDERIDLRETGCGNVEWIQLAQDKDRWQALVNTAMNLRVLARRSYLQLGDQELATARNA
jgi:hypothetical protein